MLILGAHAEILSLVKAEITEVWRPLFQLQNAQVG